jgi:hypothetical protein
VWRMTISVLTPVPGVVEERMAETEASSLCLRFDWRAVYYVRRLLGDEQRDESERLDLDRTKEKEPRLSLTGRFRQLSLQFAG